MIFLIYSFLALLFFSAFGDESYIFRPAAEGDGEQIEALLEKSNQEDRKNIVVLPACIRRTALHNALRKGHFFVCVTESQKLIAVKKMFSVLDSSELKEILAGEIRSHDENLHVKSVYDKSSILYHGGCITEVAPQETHFPCVATTLFVYNGADYTDPQYRNRRINTCLTAYAFAHMRKSTVASLRNKEKNSLCLLYGLVQQEGQEKILETRTKSLAKTFAQELEAIGHDLDPSLSRSQDAVEMICARFHAFKPVFDEFTGDVLPDDQCVPGYGHLLYHVYNEGDMHND